MVIGSSHHAGHRIGSLENGFQRSAKCPVTTLPRKVTRMLDDKPQDTEDTEDADLLIDFGDAAELTLGDGRSTNENKRQIYN